MDELKKAKVLFMTDDMDDISLEDVKKQRNRLIKMFHPDAGNVLDTKYAQKINAAYEIIKKSINIDCRIRNKHIKTNLGG